MNRQHNIAFQYFTHGNKLILQDILPVLEGVNNSLVDTELPSDILFEILDHNKNEYGAGIGFFTDGNNTVIGLGGLHFLNDAGMYEIICYTAKEYSSYRAELIKCISDKAFLQLNMDKVCMRALPGHLDNELLKAMGFSFIDERAFAEDGMSLIWNYYELENEYLLVETEADLATVDDWDAIF